LTSGKANERRGNNLSGELRTPITGIPIPKTRNTTSGTHTPQLKWILIFHEKDDSAKRELFWSCFQQGDLIHPEKKNEPVPMRWNTNLLAFLRIVGVPKLPGIP
jgi:hypothetical protein